MQGSFACLILCLALSGTSAAEDSYLVRTRGALEAAAREMPAITAAAEATAQSLAGGGKFWAAGHPALVSEFSGRASGFMYLKGLQLDQVAPGDTILYTPGGVDKADELVAIAAKGATLVCIGVAAPEGAHSLSASMESGLTPTLAGAITGWVYIAETIAALTRQGKMPVIYETIGLYSGFQRIAQFEGQGIYWHEPHTVPTIPPATLGLSYTATVGTMLERVEREMGPRIAQAAAWTAEAHAAGKQTIMYNMGHMFPHEVADTEIATLFKSEVWYSGFSQMPPPDDAYTAGDVLLHIGYQHPPYELLPKAKHAGARVVYVDILQHRDYPNNDQDVLWIDPMWPWADGVVAIPNYDVPACPASGVINAAIAWEIYRLTREALETAK
jgi:hypothetical protein